MPCNEGRPNRCPKSDKPKIKCAFAGLQRDYCSIYLEDSAEASKKNATDPVIIGKLQVSRIVKPAK